MASSPVSNSSQSWFQRLEPFLMLVPAGLWLFLLLILPTLLIFQLSLVPGIKPGDLVNPSSLENYFKIFEPSVLWVILRSISLSIVTTLLCLILGFPVAYWIALLAPKRWQKPTVASVCFATMDVFTAANLCLD